MNYRNGEYAITRIEYTYLTDNYTLTLRPLEIKNGVIPELRNYKIRFRNTREAEEVACFVDNNKIDVTSYVEDLDFVIELNGKVLPVEVKSGKDYETHRALSNIMNCEEYDLPEAVIFNNDNLHVVGKIVYAPVYMVMFIEKNNVAPTFYKVDISGL